MRTRERTCDLHAPVWTVARKDAAILRDELTVQEALDDIRSHGLGEKIVYFYVVAGDGRLVGVVPTRRLLTASLQQRLSELMIGNVVSVSQSATVLEAHDLLARHKFLALPVVDQQEHVVGVVDIAMFTDEDFNVAERERMEQVFESIGLRVSEVRDASPIRGFRFRIPWLVATIGSGVICAVLASAHEVTLTRSVAVAFFLALVLGLGESVSMQSMTVTIQTLRSTGPTFGWYRRALRREAGMAVLLGAACGSMVSLIVWLWFESELAALAIGGSVLLAILAACLLGLSVPALLHASKLDPKIAAGPFTLAVTDVCTVLLYFTLASLLL